jgi:tetratricopeptide (TPR) repeat protein
MGVSLLRRVGAFRTAFHYGAWLVSIAEPRTARLRACSMPLTQKYFFIGFCFISFHYFFTFVSMEKFAVFLTLFLFSFFALTQNWKELNGQGEKLYEQRKYKEASEIFEKVLVQAEKEFGKSDTNYAKTCNSLAKCYHDLGLYKKAEPLYMEAKEIRAKVLGKEHPEYATSCNNLAVLYYYQGLYSKAEPFFIEPKEYGQKSSAKNTRSMPNLVII